MGNDWAPEFERKNIKNTKMGSEILIPFVLGNKKEWKIHFDYLLPFFSDERYIKINGKPIFIVWNYSEEYELMEKYWNNLAVNMGLAGIKFIYKFSYKNNIPKHNLRFFYEPALSSWEQLGARMKNKLRRIMHLNPKVRKFSYDKTWKRIINRAKDTDDCNVFYGGFVGYDDTPRRGEKGQLVNSQSPKKFGDYLSRLLKICNKKNKEFLFITAWNEWGEGAYLEPDENNDYAYLEAVKKAIDEVNVNS